MDYQTIRKLDTKNKLGKRIIRAIISEKKQQQLSVRLKNKSRARLINAYCDQQEAGLKALFQTCLQHISPVTAPQLLISQLPHSGSSLLNRLFDGHPAIHAYPDELLNAFAANMPWTEINPEDDPKRWIDIFLNYVNPPNIAPSFKPDPNRQRTLPFVFLPLLQKKIFIKYLSTIDPLRPRDVLDAYTTACFGAWLNYQNHSQSKKFVTVAAPAGGTLKANVAAFFDIYPDGRLIFLIANPQYWYRCALQAESEKYADVSRAVIRWQEHFHSSLWVKERFADRTCLINGEDLTTNPEPLMQHLAGFLGLTYDPVLILPTFNGDPVSNESNLKTAALDAAGRSGREAPTLDKGQSKTISEMTTDDYQKFLNETACY
jgi:hypothetical protein